MRNRYSLGSRRRIALLLRFHLCATRFRTRRMGKIVVRCLSTLALPVGVAQPSRRRRFAAPRTSSSGLVRSARRGFAPTSSHSTARGAALRRSSRIRTSAGAGRRASAGACSSIPGRSRRSSETSTPPSRSAVRKRHQAARPARREASSPRLRTPVFAKTAFRWSCTVCGEMKSASASCFVARPSRINAASCRSRRVRS